MSAGAQKTFTTQDGLTYLVTGDGRVEVSGAESGKSSYDIPQTVVNDGVTYTVTAIGENAFWYSSAVFVTLPETIDSIKYGAFKSSYLGSINLPKSLKYIGDYAFSSTGLSEITLPESVETLGASAFFTCGSLAKITLNNGLKSIGNSAFYKCPITSITIPEGVDSISGAVFMHCTSLETVNLPSGLVYIGNAAFRGCTAMKSINLPASLKQLGDEVFLECEGLESLSIPASVESIGSGLVANSGVSRIAVDEANTNFHVVGGILYSADDRLLYAVPMKGLAEVDVYSGCVGIMGGAFWGSEVKKVTLHEGLAAIDSYAFCQSALESINFPSSLIYIGEQGFAATRLTEVTLPENMPYVYDGAFAGCEQMTSLTIPSGVKMIYNHAFHNATKLASVTCLGSVPPVIDEVYDDYDSPFYSVGTSEMKVPKGTAAAYREAGWGSYFSTITEGEKGVLAYKSTTPADGSVFTDKYAELKFDVEFAEPVTIVEPTPKAYMRVGSLIGGQTVRPDDAWNASLENGGNTLRVWGSDYDGFTMTFAPKAGETYYMIIPAGVVKNAAGETNEQIVISVKGGEEASIGSIESGAEGAKAVARYNINGQKVDASHKGLTIVKMSDGTTRKVVIR